MASAKKRVIKQKKRRPTEELTRANYNSAKSGLKDPRNTSAQDLSLKRFISAYRGQNPQEFRGLDKDLKSLPQPRRRQQK